MTFYKPTPPPAPRALNDEALAAVASMRKLGVPQTKIAEHLGVDIRTLSAAIHKRGAYAQERSDVATD